ncbi:hypothetical protein QRO08_12685 [Paracidovorax citrulli]|uniref:Uncharacterized protein n=2 Tax=Paracidovorax citrulli TaxID=80869 RepID=A1TR92_PARC0|nr:hypothetical protein [Paracidovorax citrulli]ABM33480.1 hypothetical protein Aave_2912 [Paracidovorax citrulli AAC00-1]ATG94107.1 hypothetical protein CQB05_08740 [Paracidovorax citrulli]MVT38919.1 hypothetical protein [Paracidovorax citrulli]PVY67539.1 hypothetical protein C8E08_4987 [Paracidovorax citrulli]REG68302.1 hypothetical protein C8E07_1404 [Paracidovorax citrulli]
MSKGLTRDTAQLWNFLRADKGWWSVLRLTGHWAPTFTEREIEEHMETLSRGVFVVSKYTERMGTVYAVTPDCRLLPGTDAPAPMPQPPSTDIELAPPPRRDAMSTFYRPTPTNFRDGALDHQRHPSLIGDRRFTHRSPKA